jgi:putative transposase
MPSDIHPITYGTFYHINNRGNNRENMFFQERNYAYFLELWWTVTRCEPLAETWAYCLLRNHFHAVVYIKKKEVLSGFNKPPSRYFSNFFNAYARGLNIATQRTGTLFQRPFKRILGNPSYLMRPIVYIHQNPQKHHFTEDFRDWNYLSYHELTSDAATRLQRDWVIKLFGSRADFVRIHQEIQPLEVLEDGD